MGYFLAEGLGIGSYQWPVGLRWLRLNGTPFPEEGCVWPQLFTAGLSRPILEAFVPTSSGNPTYTFLVLVAQGRSGPRPMQEGFLPKLCSNIDTAHCVEIPVDGSATADPVHEPCAGS